MGTPELELQCLPLKVRGGTCIAMDTCEIGRAIEEEIRWKQATLPMVQGQCHYSWRHRVKKGWGVAGRHKLAVCPGESLLCCVIMRTANNARLHLCPQVQRTAPGSRTTTRFCRKEMMWSRIGHRTHLLPCGSVWEDRWALPPNHREVGARAYNTDPSSSFS